MQHKDESVLKVATDPQEIMINSLTEIKDKARQNDEQILAVHQNAIKTDDKIQNLQGALNDV